jgi:hypothetical protein
MKIREYRHTLEILPADIPQPHCIRLHEVVKQLIGRSGPDHLMQGQESLEHDLTD